jgi:predicted restriction endonuclease
MKFFIKKLRSNESGYSGDVPDRRGKFILIPKSCYDFFPEHSTKYLNDITLVRFKTPSGNIISRKYDWHNAKYHTSSRTDLNRDHDEKRLYRSKSLDKDLDLDRNVFFICCNEGDRDEYSSFSVTEENKNYDYLNKKFKKAQIVEDKVIDGIFKAKFGSTQFNEEQIIIEKDIIDSFSDDSTNTAKEDLILSETYFRELVMKAYGSKCCVREDSIVYGDKIILQAAHIKPKRAPHYGKNIPSNGLALSYDLHRMFDEGMWTLTDELEVLVHPKVQDQHLLGIYQGNVISPLIEGSFFKPDPEYLKFHRESEFGRFDTKR